MSAIIDDVAARKIFNSRGEETIEIDILTIGGFGSASAPSGASRGKDEVIPFPEGGVDEAIRKVEEQIAPELIGLAVEEQEEIDSLLHNLDGTEIFQNIGGNTAYAISMAVVTAAANTYNLPLFHYLGGYRATELPLPLGNVMGGGKHALGKTPDIQEFLVLPVGAQSLSDAIKANIAVHRKLRDYLKNADPSFTGGRGDEGAWAPNITNNNALEILVRACENVSETTGFEIRAGLDVAASSLWDSEKKVYIYQRDGLSKDTGEQIEYILELIKRGRLVYVEDPFHEDDFESFRELTSKAPNCLICGDDLFVTNMGRLQKGINDSSGNAIIIKMNQIGTLTDTWKTTRLASANGYVPVMSHRSGETTSFHISHLAVGFGCPIIKTGVMGGERLTKLNELIRIEETLGRRGRIAHLKI